MPALLLALLLLPQQDAATHLVSFSVTREALKYDAPCEATAYEVGRGKDPTIDVATTVDAESGFQLASGSYQVVIGCPSSEGTFRQTFDVRVKGADLSVPVKMVPGFVVANVIRNGVDVPATVTILDANNRVLAKGRDKVPHPVPAGKLTVRAVVDKKAAGRRKPVRAETEVRVSAGKKTVATLDSSDGRMLLSVTANRKQAEGIGALRKKGSLDRLVELTAGVETEVPPGTYELVTSLYNAHDYHEITTSDVTVQPGKLSKISVNHPVAEVSADVRLDGKPLADPYKAEIALFLGEAITPFAKVNVGETALLKPGKFRLKARITNHKLDDGSEWFAESSLNLRAGQHQKPRIELAPARVEVTTTMGKEPMTTELQILLPDGKAPITKRKVGRSESVALQLPAGRFRIRSVMKTPHGEHEVEQLLNLKAGRATKLALDHDLGRALVQVFEKKVAVPARVSFVADGAADAALKIKAGKEAFLPPGSYTLIVHRGDKEQTFSAIKIAAGRLTERQVEFDPRPAQKDEPAPTSKAKAKDEPLPEGDDDGNEIP